MSLGGSFKDKGAYVSTAKVHEIDGNRMDVNREAIKAERKGRVYVGHWWNPYFIEGEKTMAHETYEQIGNVDYVIVPVGSGTILLGLYKGYKKVSRTSVFE